MKKVLLSVTLLFLAAGSAGQAQAQVNNLTQLDKLKTCTSEQQKLIGRISLDWLNAFKSWWIRPQLGMVHNDLIVWHSSLAQLAVAVPAQARLFPQGQMKVPGYLQTLTFLAFANDKDRYEIVPSRADCVGNDTVILTTVFSGVQLRRDAAGYVTHETAFGSPTRVVVRFRDERTDSNGRAVRGGQLLIDRLSFDLKDNASTDVRQAEPTPVERNEDTRGTFCEILQRFIDDAGPTPSNADPRSPTEVALATARAHAGNAQLCPRR